MLEGRELVPAGGHVDRRLDALGVQRIHLGTQQVELQMRMHLAHLGRVVAQPVMALREDGDAVDVGVLERLREGLGVEPLADAGNVGMGVEVEMDLAKTHSGSAQIDRRILGMRLIDAILRLENRFACPALLPAVNSSLHRTVSVIRTVFVEFKYAFGREIELAVLRTGIALLSAGCGRRRRYPPDK